MSLQKRARTLPTPEFFNYDRPYRRLCALLLGNRTSIDRIRSLLSQWRSREMQAVFLQKPTRCKSARKKLIPTMCDMMFVTPGSLRTEEQERKEFRELVLDPADDCCHCCEEVLQDLWRDDELLEPCDGWGRLVPRVLWRSVMGYFSLADIARLGTCNSTWLHWVWRCGAAYLTSWRVKKNWRYELEPTWLLGQANRLDILQVTDTSELETVVKHGRPKDIIVAFAGRKPPDNDMKMLAFLPESCRKVVFHDCILPKDVILPPTVVNIYHNAPKCMTAQDFYDFCATAVRDPTRPLHRCVFVCYRPSVPTEHCNGLIQIRHGKMYTFSFTSQHCTIFERFVIADADAETAANAWCKFLSTNNLCGVYNFLG